VISYRVGAGTVSAADVEPFFVGWPSPPSPERRVELLRRSDDVVLAYDGERLVGFVTAVTDGSVAAYVPLLEVLPEYQRRGIGSELVRRILARLGDLYMVDLACDEDLVGFYERLGLRRVGAAMGVRRPGALAAVARASFFDDVVIVDWSASSIPKRGPDSIWIGRAWSVSAEAMNVATRGQALRVLVEQIVDLARAGRRVLVGFDFPYGYPRGTADRLGLRDEDGDEAPWLRMWNELATLVTDGPTNANNRFEVAAELNQRGACFWGKPATVAADVPPKKQPFTLPELRATERLLRSGARYPKSVWQLSGAGSVGSQALVGIPVVKAVRFDVRLADLSAVWPFETGFNLPRDVQVVHAEIWPGVIQPDATAHAVADARQVLTLARHLHGRDETELERLFAAGAGDEAARFEEGWILGAL
jgi:precorrin-8X/cobalt-precorrin-8 methylmutase